MQGYDQTGFGLAVAGALGQSAEHTNRGSLTDRLSKADVTVSSVLVNGLKTIWKAIATTVAESRAESDLASNSFTPRALNALTVARKEAKRMHHEVVDTEHVLIGLIDIRQGVVVNVLRKAGVDPEKLRAKLIDRMCATSASQQPKEPHFTIRVKKVLALAIREAKTLNHEYVGTDDILLGILVEGNGAAAQIFRELGFELNKLRADIVKGLMPDLSASE